MSLGGLRRPTPPAVSDSGRIRTCNLLIRSQVLYPVEPRSHFPASQQAPTACLAKRRVQRYGLFCYWRIFFKKILSATHSFSSPGNSSRDTTKPPSCIRQPCLTGATTSNLRAPMSFIAILLPLRKAGESEALHSRAQSRSP